MTSCGKCKPTVHLNCKYPCGPDCYERAVELCPYHELMDEMVEALAGAPKIARPWMDGALTFEEWCNAVDKLTSLLAKARSAKAGGQ